jgi:Undecaprenyl-phosphate glucose phosphotransferase
MIGELIQALYVVADIVIILAVAALADRALALAGDTSGDLTRSALVVAVMFVGIVALRGGYRLDVLTSMRRRLQHGVTAWLATFGLAAWVAFLLKTTGGFSRIETSVLFVVGGAATLLAQMLLAHALSSRTASGALSFRRCFAVVLGENVAPTQIAERLRRRGTEVVGSHRVALRQKSFAQDCLAALDAARASLAETSCDCVLVFAPWREERQIEEAVALLGALPIPVVLMADAPTQRVLHHRQMNVGPLIGFEISRAPLSRADRALKRGLDLAVALSALVLLSPLLLFTAMAILIESGRPICFRQNRRGFGGREFRIWKFRSMTVQENGPNVPQARRDDPRVTPLGRVLRRTSIDELPQLLNVLKGEMSIVGPRPHAIAHDNHYDQRIATYAFRQHVKPGITGWAQVNGLRGETRQLCEMEARVEHDLWYINNWSIWLDIRIIIRTALKVVSLDRDAY